MKKPAPLSSLSPEDVERGREALAQILQRLRWNDQDGYVGYSGNGKWQFYSTALPQTSPEELNALFKLAGIDPDVIKSKGNCHDCVYSIGGKERGYANPCNTCRRPQMSHFSPKDERPVSFPIALRSTSRRFDRCAFCHRDLKTIAKVGHNDRCEFIGMFPTK